jgi:uncharacterized delta-60 repeat protein
VHQRRLKVRARAALLAGVSLCSAIAITGGIGGANRAGAAAGDLDPTFGSGGVATRPFAVAGHARATALVIQPDGKVLVGGSVGQTGSFVARFNIDGSLDPAWGNAGVFTGAVSRITDGALQTDGRLVISYEDHTGGAFQNVRLARLTSSGALDPSFGVGGHVVVATAANSRATGVEVQADGRIVAYGTAWAPNTNSDLFLVRLTAAGALDPTFSDDGMQTAGLSSIGMHARGAVRPDGRIVVVGDAIGGPVAVFGADGRRDPGFGAGGISSVPDMVIDTVAVQGDNRIVVGGMSVASATNGAMAVTRITATGLADATFTGGPVPFGRAGHVLDLAVQADQRIAVTGFDNTSGMFIGRLTATGQLDPTFANGAVLDTGVADPSEGHRVAVLPNGRLVSAGHAFASAGADPLALARVTAGGTLDGSFGSGGRVARAIASEGASGAPSVTLTPDGRAVLAVPVHETPESKTGLVRLTSTGSTDPGFDASALLSRPGSEVVRKVAVLPDGRVVTGGTVSGPNGSDCFVSRFLASGAADLSFGVGGVAVVDLLGFDTCEAVDVAADGRVVIAGHGIAGPSTAIGIARLTPAGVLDVSFDGDGRLIEATSTGGTVPRAVTIDSVGRVVVAVGRPGSLDVRRLAEAGAPDVTWNSGGAVTLTAATTASATLLHDDSGRLVVGIGGPSTSIVRLTSTGAVDQTFSAGQPVALPGHWGPVALGIQPDGRIIVGAATEHPGATHADAMLSRLTTTGQLDATLGAAGWVTFDLGGSEHISSVAHQIDGSIIAAGWSQKAGEVRTARAFVMRVPGTSPVPPTTVPPGGSGCVSQSFSDPTGGGQPDIASTSLTFDCANRQWSFLMTAAAGFADSQLDALDLVLDVDRSPSTGCGGYDFHLIALYDPDVFGTVGVGIRTPTCDPVAWSEVGPVAVVRANGSPLVELRFGHATIGSPSSFAWAAFLFMNGVEEPDFEPDGADHVMTLPPNASSTQTPNPQPNLGVVPGSGYWMLDLLGSVYSFGPGAQFYGSSAGFMGEALAVDIEPIPTGRGYWILDDFGAVYDFGDAPWFGDAFDVPFAENEYASSLSRTPSGNGYWIFTNLGRAFPFGDARPHGDLSQTRLNGEILGSVSTPSGLGYYMVGSDGGIFAFGDARFFGSMGASRLNAPVLSMVPTASGAGYWLVAEDGGIFAFGDAGFVGSIPGVLAPGQRLNQPITGMVRYGNGYLMVAADGGIFSFSNQQFFGSLGGIPIAAPIFSVAVAPGSAATAGVASVVASPSPDELPSRWVAAGLRTLSA